MTTAAAAAAKADSLAATQTYRVALSGKAESNFAHPGGGTGGRLSDIVANTSNFYVSVDSLDYPDGALRGQL